MNKTHDVLRCETEVFDDGHKSARYFDADNTLVRIESLDSNDNLKVAIDYLYTQGVNRERIVRDSTGNILRRIMLDESGEEIDAGSNESVRWKLMDGTDEGTDVKGEEKVGG